VRVRAGRPVPGATVAVRSWGTDASGKHLTRETESDADGRFRFELPAGEYDLTVRARGFVHAFASQETASLGRDVVQDLLVVPATRLRGTIRSSSGMPLVARVGRVCDRVDGTSGADGTFVLDDLREGDVSFYAAADGYVQRWLRDVPVFEGLGADVEVVLDPAGELAGTVRTTAGVPAPDAEVTLVSGNAEHRTYDVDLFVTRADARGAFAFQGLPGGPCTLAVRQGALAGRETAVVVAGRSLSVDLVLLPGPRIEGRAIDRRGAPLPRRVVEARCRESSSYDRTSTDAEGRFVVADCFPGASYDVRAGRTWANGDSILAFTWTSVEGGGPRLDLVFPDPASVSGVVVGPDGRPYDAPVTIATLDDGPAWLERGATDEGRFAFENLPPGRRCRIQATTQDETGERTRAEAEVVLAEGSAVTGVRLELRPLGTISGAFVSASGAALSSVPFELVGTATAAGKSGPDGRFSVRVVAGTYAVRVPDAALDLVAKRLGARRARIPPVVLAPAPGETVERTIVLGAE
jgi:hypothetical protein